MGKKEELKEIDKLEEEYSEKLEDLRNKVKEKYKNVKVYTIKDINSYEDACMILKELPSNIADVSKKIKTIVKAVNYLDNDNTAWKPDFTKNNVYMYLPHFIKNGSGWSLRRLHCFGDFSRGPAGFYFKVSASGTTIVNKFINLYKIWLEE